MNFFDFFFFHSNKKKEFTYAFSNSVSAKATPRSKALHNKNLKETIVDDFSFEVFNC